jgi:hypothetical protein
MKRGRRKQHRHVGRSRASPVGCPLRLRIVAPIVRTSVGGLAYLGFDQGRPPAPVDPTRDEAAGELDRGWGAVEPTFRRLKHDDGLNRSAFAG